LSSSQWPTWRSSRMRRLISRRAPTRKRPVPQQMSPQRKAGRALSASVWGFQRPRWPSSPRRAQRSAVGDVVKDHARHALHHLARGQVGGQALIAGVLAAQEDIEGPAEQVLVDQVGAHLAGLLAIAQQLAVGDGEPDGLAVAVVQGKGLDGQREHLGILEPQRLVVGEDGVALAGDIGGLGVFGPNRRKYALAIRRWHRASRPPRSRAAGGASPGRSG
jgi:hypothetical protein